MTTIPNFPHYTIDTDGKVWSNKSNKYLNPIINTQGYQVVGLRSDGKTAQKYIHRLVGEIFIPNPDNLPTIDHINRLRYDNRVCNLRWASRETQSNNLGKRNDNTSGHKYITYHSHRDNWVFQRTKDRKRIVCYISKSKIDCLCIKFAWIILDANRHRTISVDIK
jgi:hypothetical protein